MYSLEEVIENNIKAALRNVYTSLPAIVRKVHIEDKSTVVDVEVGIDRKSELKNFGTAFIKRVMVKWLAVNGCYITMPIKEGDTVLLHFLMRDSGTWMLSKGESSVEPKTKEIHGESSLYATPSYLTYSTGVVADPDAVVIASDNTKIRILKNGTIELGDGAIEAIMKGNTFIDKFLNHTHTVLNPSGIPVLSSVVTTTVSSPDQLELWSDVLSEVNKTK